MVNHRNAWFGMIDHPRFVKIRSIILTKDVEANEELLTNYGFLEKFIEVPDKSSIQIFKMCPLDESLVF